ncbi:glycine betaine ABC transporter substrate-binding protein [Nocardioides sp.]|uniref:glycine betaine ABC transporter substrate-binding protein n=1 Tax=Nocardioides sp. TaxID=35761 RepID=UPI0019AF57DC|nr:glycine betaine ABC transporter substrate-binding protein [Nocardioides sp.]MBC7279191.1 glycine betaine ABC transporter substrate-binding protein [Nocardioides sp.]
MFKRHLSVPARLGVAMLAVALVATGCGSDGGADGADKTITMGVIPGWTDQSATTYVLKNVMEDNGYTVEITELNDNAPMYTALSKGDIDVLSSAWPELTHKTYMDTYGKDLEDLGVFFEGATSFLAVPDYMEDINSIDDLPAHADEFDGTITGIEPGAGLTRMTKEDVVPAYGLDKDFELQLSSTPAMLTELGKATKAEEPIVITMWKPFWANLNFPIKALEDPEGAFGEPEDLHVLAREGFSDDQPEVAEMMSNFTLTEEEFGTIEGMIVNDYEQGEEEEAAADWLADNPEVADELAAHLA